MTCPHEQLRGRCYHPSLAPWPGNCLDDDTCPGGFGPWGAWRAVVGRLVPLLNEMDRPAIFCGQTTGEEIESWFVQRLEWSEELIALGTAGWLS